MFRVLSRVGRLLSYIYDSFSICTSLFLFV